MDDRLDPPHGQEDSLNINSQDNFTVLKESGFGLLRFQLSEALEYSFKHSQPHFRRLGKHPIHLN